MIRQTLRELPVGLVETYERILLKISKSPLARQEIALRMFRWTVCSRRLMKAEELQEAVAFEKSDMFWDRDKIPDETLMIETCRGLLVRDEEDRTVRFAHHTVQQYLLSAPAIRTEEGPRFSISPRSEAEALIGRVCVTYLCFSDFETQIALRTPNLHLEPLGVLKTGGPVRLPTVLGIGKSLLEIPYRLFGGKSSTAALNIDYSKYLTPNKRTRPQIPSGLTEKYRLLEYVVEFWMDHTQRLAPAFHAKFRHLVMHKTLSFEFRPWGLNQHFGNYGCVSCSDPTKAKDLPFTSLFHYAAQAGHWNLMESLVTEYCQHEVPLDQTLLIACREGQDLIVQNLMRRFTFDISDGRAVHVAAAAGNAGVLKYFMHLSQNTAEGGRKFSLYKIKANACSLLNLAATNGHKEVVDVILTWCHWDDPESFTDSDYINKKDENTGRTAFFSAIMSGQENIVRDLLARGAKIEAHGSTAIHMAADYGHQEILRMLLEIATKDLDNDGGEVDAPKALLCSYDSGGDTPLHHGARNGHFAVVALILKHLPRFESGSIDWGTYRNGFTNSKPAVRYTPLHLAARAGYLDVIQILIDNGVNVEAETHFLKNSRGDFQVRFEDEIEGNGYTALHSAAEGGHLDALKILKDNGANLRARTKVFEWTALHLAAAEGHEAVTAWLLQNGAQSRAEAKDGTKALQLAVNGDHDGVVRTLLKIHPGKDIPFDGYNQGEMLAWIKTAAENGKDSVLRAIFESSGSLGTATGVEYLKAALRVAEREKQKGTVGLIMSFLEANSPD